MTDFGEIPPLSASSNVFYSYMLSASYVTIDLLNTLIADIGEIKTQLDDINQGSNAASLLASEYFSNQDLDGDGLIYGVDFYISDPPEMLSTIPARGTIRTWAQYKDSHPELF
jgi:hypothetical protein